MSKLNGYRATHKNKWLFVKHKILSIQELSLLEYYADIFIFDFRKEKVGLFEVNFNELTEVFNCKSENTIRNWHKKLLQLGFIKKTDKKHVYSLACYSRYITPGFWKGKSAEYAEAETNQPIGIILQNFGVNLQSIGEELQPVEEKETEIDTKVKSKALISSKDESSSSLKRVVVIKQESRSESEYQKIKEEGGYEHLTISDMEWIDENVVGKEVIEDEATEKNIVEIFFKGGWDEYRRHLIVE